MVLETTVVGSYPKPEYLRFLPDWYNRGTSENFSLAEYNKAMVEHKDEIEALTNRATKEVIDEQTAIGIDVITNGEIIRENYLMHFCRQITGIDFSSPHKTSIRNGACVIEAPVINGKMKLSDADGSSQCCQEWSSAQSMSKKPVKFTIPGPMSLMNSLYFVEGNVYQSQREASEDLLCIINHEVRALAKEGCKFIQVDEPVLVRSPEIAVEYGIDNLKRCFEGVGPEVTKVVHLCCGYPCFLDQTDYLKADPSVYHVIAEKLDAIGVDQISIEDAHRHNDLDLFSKFKKTKLIVGVVKIASSQIETVDEIRKRVSDIMKYIPKEKLILAPDCGLAFLADKAVRRTKLKNMVEAAKSF